MIKRRMMKLGENVHCWKIETKFKFQGHGPGPPPPKCNSKNDAGRRLCGGK